MSGANKFELPAELEGTFWQISDSCRAANDNEERRHYFQIGSVSMFRSALRRRELRGMVQKRLYDLADDLGMIGCAGGWDIDAFEDFLAEAQVAAIKLKNVASAKQPAGRPAIRSLAEWSQEGADDPDPLIADHESGSIIGREEVGILYGPTGSGKTAVLNAMLFGIASGQGVGQGHLTGEPLYKCKPGRVLIAVYEAQRDYRHRTHAMAKHHGTDLAVLNWGIIQADLDITNEKHRKAFIDRVREDWINDNDLPAVIAIDTLAASVGGESLNGDDVVGHCFALGYALRDEFGASVVFVAHPGKDADRGVAGSYRLRQRFCSADGRTQGWRLSAYQG